jgi:hypothetical protein
VICLQFQRDPMSTRRDAAKNGKIYRPKSKKLSPNAAHEQKVICSLIKRDPMNRRRGAAKKVLCTSSKVHFFNDRSHGNL